jgi:hypothetical protein
MAQTGFLLRRKSDGWVATGPDFVNDEMDPAGFGKTAADAVADLTRHPRFREWMEQTGHAAPKIDEFDIDEGNGGGVTAEREGKHGNFPPFRDPGKH